MKSLEDVTEAVQQINIVRHLLNRDGNFPNNSNLPLLIYQQALHTNNSKTIKDLFESNGWVNSWQAGVYNFDHYHSTAHEVLGVLKGNALLSFGGPNGISIPVAPGDVIIIPAGVSHKLSEGDDDFQVIGAYPEGQTYDIMRGTAEEKEIADQNISKVALPDADPIYGIDGPLTKNWHTPTLKD